MPIGVSEDHLALHAAVAGWCERHCPPAVPRALLDAERQSLPPFWSELSAQGWLGLHLPEEHGGSGYGLPELVVVLEELGRVVAPGPTLPTVLAAALVQRGGDEALAKSLLPALATGERVGAVALDAAPALTGAERADGLHVEGTVRPVLAGHLADVLLAPVRVADRLEWCALDVPADQRRELPSVDRTRRVAEVAVDAVVPADRRLPGLAADTARDVAAVLVAAEAVGVAQWCVTTAAEHAATRVQFGRPIGQFQGVKHRCADMLGRLELARAATWDAARATADAAASLTASSALALALDAAFANAKDCIQVLGGVGFTWEHDAHVYLRRALSLRSLLGPEDAWRMRAAAAARDGARRVLAVDLGEDADRWRAELRAFLASVQDLAADEQRRAVADAGYIMPTWPKPWGRDAKAAEQLVIQEEFRRARVPRPGIMVGSWALPPVIVYGTREQQERWIPPTLRGQIMWCQLFSEPGAGSDLASLSTRATRADGGWRVTGQKVWTSMAHLADWGILLARTDATRPKHEGISCFLVDMRGTDGLEVRPLRELTGDSMFNEVFFDDAFIPDDCLIGSPGDGWRAARTTLANERVFMGSGLALGPGLEQILQRLARADGSDPLVLDEVGGLVATGYALACLGFRLTLAALSGADPSGSEAAVRKLLGVLHDQHVQEVGLTLLGPEGAVEEGEGAVWSRGFLFNRNLTIAGGTSEIQRNIIGERVLGLPRDA
ncbi:MAG TPA: acyl-CoA dehydrogenase [Acidimicrobiia bacterium]|nr:acyl-CoA dehydrogenase [Acidimicrobiia bacterium]